MKFYNRELSFSSQTHPCHETYHPDPVAQTPNHSFDWSLPPTLHLSDPSASVAGSTFSAHPRSPLPTICVSHGDYGDASEFRSLRCALRTELTVLLEMQSSHFASLLQMLQWVSVRLHMKPALHSQLRSSSCSATGCLSLRIFAPLL